MLLQSELVSASRRNADGALLDSATYERVWDACFEFSGITQNYDDPCKLIVRPSHYPIFLEELLLSRKFARPFQFVLRDIFKKSANIDSKQANIPNERLKLVELNASEFCSSYIELLGNCLHSMSTLVWRHHQSHYDQLLNESYYFRAVEKKGEIFSRSDELQQDLCKKELASYLQMLDHLLAQIELQASALHFLQNSQLGFQFIVQMFVQFIITSITVHIAFVKNSESLCNFHIFPNFNVKRKFIVFPKKC